MSIDVSIVLLRLEALCVTVTLSAQLLHPQKLQTDQDLFFCLLV